MAGVVRGFWPAVPSGVQAADFNLAEVNRYAAANGIDALNLSPAESADETPCNRIEPDGCSTADPAVPIPAARPFSPTTVLSGDAVFVLGANRFGGSENHGARTPDENARNFGATVFNYDARLNLSTSFTGRDLLYLRLRSGNFNSSPFSGRPFNLMALRVFSPAAGPNVVEIDRLFYRFPIGRTVTALVGSRARNTEFLAIRPSFYGGRGTTSSMSSP